MTSQDIQSIREFNRFYTNVLGLLDQHLLESPFTLPEARVLFELHEHQPCSASDLLANINMDKGYLSRVLKSFRQKGLILKKTSGSDARTALLSLSSKGEREFQKLDHASIGQLSNLLGKLAPTQVRAVIKNMQELQELLKV